MKNKKIEELLMQYANAPVYYDTQSNAKNDFMKDVADKYNVQGVKRKPNGSYEWKLYEHILVHINMFERTGQITPAEKSKTLEVMNEFINTRNKQIQDLIKLYELLDQNFQDIYTEMCKNQADVNAVEKIISKIKPQVINGQDYVFALLCESFAQHYQDATNTALIRRAYKKKMNEYQEFLKKEKEKQQKREEKGLKKREKTQKKPDPEDGDDGAENAGA